MNGEGLKTGLVEAPADGRVSWTARADLAEADAMILADEGRYDCATPALTASRAIDLEELASIASEVLGRPISRKLLSDEDLKARMIGRGAPEGAAQMVLGLYIASRNGEFAGVDPTLEEMLRRRPTSMADLIVNYASGKG